MSRSYFFLIVLLLVAGGCMRVDTNPEPIFSQVKEEVEKRASQTVYWDSSMSDAVEEMSVDRLLEQELTGDFVVQVALLNNPTLQATYEHLGIAKAKLAQAGLWKNPLFSFAYRFSTRPNVTSLIDMGLFQNFLEILLIPLKKRTAQAELEETKSMLIAKILDVIAETKVAFYSLQAAERVWELKKQILLATELSYEAAQKLFAVGNLKDLEVSMERSLYEQAKLEVASGEITVLDARERLNVLMGLWGCQIDWKIVPSLSEIPLQEEVYDNIENDAIARSIDLKTAYHHLLATAASFGINTTKLVFPQFDVGVSSAREEGVWYVGPAFNLSIPLFDFGKANSAKAKATIMYEWNRYTALAVEIRSKARSSRFSYLNALRQSEYLEKVIIPLAQQITHSTLLQHNAMQLGIFPLLAAKTRELEKGIQHIEMKKEYWISKTILQTLLSGHMVGRDVFLESKRKEI